MSKMKHFLRKFHIGGSSGCSGGDVTEDENLQNQRNTCQASSSTVDDTQPESPSPLLEQQQPPPPPPSNSATEETVTSVSSSAPAYSGNSSTVNSSANNNNAIGNAGDYGLGEEEFQVQLALAISVSDRDSREDAETAQIQTAKQISLGCLPSESLVDFMSLQYWSYNVVNYDEKVMDGFYDVHGFISDMMPQDKMPMLVDLQSIPVAADDNYQVIVVNSAVDTELRKLVDKVHSLPIKFPFFEVDTDIIILVQKIADIVVDRMGGPVNDAEEMPRKWTCRSFELKKALNSIVLPLGCLDVGLSRHRALLFKVLADQINLPCKLVKGSYYSGTDDGAVNLIKFSNGSEYMIDLMGAPGTLIPSEVSSSHQESRGVTPVGDATYPEFSSGSVLSGPGIIGVAKISTEPYFANSKLMEHSGDAFGDTFKELLNYEFGNVSLLKASEEPLKAKSKRSAVQVANTPGNLVISSEGPPILDFQDLVPKGELLEGVAVVDSHHFPLIDLSNNDQAIIPVTEAHPSCNKHTAIGVGSSSATALGNNLVENKPDRMIKTVDILEKFDETTLSHQSSSQLAQNNQVDAVLGGVAEWEIPWEDLLIAERIGIGSYGEVHRAEWNGTEVAVKKFMNQDISGDALEQFKCEIEIMLRLRHPNLVLFMGAVTRPPNLSILTEYLPRGSLFKLLHRSSSQIDEKRRLRMAIDVAKGMNYLHTSHPMIVHRDLKTPNLLVDKNWGVKVCDFGMSRLKHHTFLSSKSTAGTAEWMAPEVLRNEPCNEKCDVYSFGVILWELATLEVPWTGMNSMQVVGAVGFQGRRLKIPDLIDPMAADLIIECWTPKPVERPSFAQILSRLKRLQHLVLPKADHTPIHQP